MHTYVVFAITSHNYCLLMICSILGKKKISLTDEYIRLSVLHTLSHILRMKPCMHAVEQIAKLTVHAAAAAGKKYF